MYGSNRGNADSIIGLLFIGFILIFALIGYGYGIQQAGSKHAEKQSKIHTENAENHIKNECVGLVGSEFSKCVHDAIKASGEYQRADQDLNAQSQMSHWALLLLILTAVTILATIVGVIYVRRTLSATIDVGRDQSRAYVHVDSAKIHWGNSNETNPNFILGIINTGNTPAKWFEIDGYTIVSEYDCDCPLLEEDRLFVEKPYRWNSLTNQKILTVGLHNKFISRDLRSAKEKRRTHMIELLGTVRYETFFGEVFETQFHFIRKDLRGFEGKIISSVTKKRKLGGGIIDVVENTTKEKSITMQRGPATLRTYEKTK